jgi:hypothetical protein
MFKLGLYGIGAALHRLHGTNVTVHATQQHRLAFDRDIVPVHVLQCL